MMVYHKGNEIEVNMMPALILAAILLSFWLGVFTGDSHVKSEVEINNIEGYHCTPVTKHIGIESAKAQVEAYQAMIKG